MREMKYLLMAFIQGILVLILNNKGLILISVPFLITAMINLFIGLYYIIEAIKRRKYE
jgi:hypothetical protein